MIDESRRRQGTKAQSSIPIYMWTDPHPSRDLDLNLTSHWDQSSCVQSRRIHLLIGVDGRLLDCWLCRLLGQYSSRRNIRVGLLYLASAVASAQNSSDFVIIRMCRPEGPPFFSISTEQKTEHAYDKIRIQRCVHPSYTGMIHFSRASGPLSGLPTSFSFTWCPNAAL